MPRAWQETVAETLSSMQPLKGASILCAFALGQTERKVNKGFSGSHAGPCFQATTLFCGATGRQESSSILSFCRLLLEWTCGLLVSSVHWVFPIHLGRRRKTPSDSLLVSSFLYKHPYICSSFSARAIWGWQMPPSFSRPIVKGKECCELEEIAFDSRLQFHGLWEEAASLSVNCHQLHSLQSVSMRWEAVPLCLTLFSRCHVS